VKEFRVFPAFTDEDDEFIKAVLEKYAEGIIPKNATKRIKQQIEKVVEPMKVLTILKKEIPVRLLAKQIQTHSDMFYAKREVILSEWLKGSR